MRMVLYEYLYLHQLYYIIIFCFQFCISIKWQSNSNVIVRWEKPPVYIYIYFIYI